MGPAEQRGELSWAPDVAGAAQLVAESLRAWPHEACGLLVGDGCPERPVVRAVRPSRNLADLARAATEFSLDPVALMRAERWAVERGWRVLCVWHSHPSGGVRPSRRDREGDPGYGWHVIVPIPAIGPPWPQFWRVSGTQP